METLGDRIRKLREARGRDAREFANAVGLAYSSLMDLENGHSKSTKRLHAIIAELGTTSEYLERGRGPRDAEGAPTAHVSAAATPADYVRVQQLDGDAGMGDGRINDDYPEVIRAVDYTRDYIRGMVGFVPPPGRLVLITGRGDSMIPTIMPGESLLVDTGVSAFDGDGIYLVNLGSGQQIKRLVDHGGAEGIYVHSDNTAVYQPRPLPKEHVIGGKVYLRNRIDRLS